jgi:hypothetical protein
MKLAITHIIAGIMAVFLFQLSQAPKKTARLEVRHMHGNWFENGTTCTHSDGKKFTIQFVCNEDGTMNWREVEKE